MVPRLVECHVIAWLEFDPPMAVSFFARAWHKSKCRPEPLDLKWLHLNATIFNRAKLYEPVLKSSLGSSAVQLSACAHVIDPSLQKAPPLIEQIFCNEFRPALPPIAGTNGVEAKNC